MAEDVKNQGFTPLEIIINANRKAKFLTGFTLIELLMVMVIVGILAVVTITRFESFSPIKLDGATKKAVSDIRYVQHFAISKHADSKIEFDDTANSYEACYCNEPDGDCDDIGDCGDSNWSPILDPFTRTGLVVDFINSPEYKGIDIRNLNFDPNFGGDTLQFNWLGGPSAGGSLNLVYQERIRTISITPNTGRVSAE